MLRRKSIYWERGRKPRIGRTLLDKASSGTREKSHPLLPSIGNTSLNKAKEQHQSSFSFASGLCFVEWHPHGLLVHADSAMITPRTPITSGC